MLNEISVLHVDDDPSITDLTGTFLEREDDRFAVQTATSADEGLESISDRPPDCVVSDYNMPGMDGIEFLQAVRQEYPDLPFILYTGKGSEAVASEAIAADVTDYLQKQSGTEHYELLANRIENAVQSRRQAEWAERQEQLMRLTEFEGETGGFEIDTEAGEVLRTDGARRIMNLPEQTTPNFETNLQHFHPDDRKKIRQSIQQALQTGEQTDSTLRYQCPDGEEKLLSITYTPVTTNGDTTTIRGAIHDVTDRQDRQQELQDLEDRFELAVEGADLGVWDRDMTTDEVEFNEQWAEMLGYSREELEFSFDTWERLVHPDDLPSVTDVLEKHIEGDTDLYSHEIRMQTKDGDWKWILTAGRVVDRNDEETPTRAVGVHIDINDRKQAKQELEQTSQLLQETQEVANVGGWEVDLRSETMRWSDEVYRIHGLPLDANPTPEEGIEFYHPDDRDTIREAFNRLTTEGEPYNLELRIVTAYDDVRWVRTRGEPRYEDDEIVAVQGTFQDITERKEQEREMQRQNERLEEFASIVSHDLRNPLRVADGRLELIRDECASDHIDDVAQALDRMDTLIKDLLTLAREGNQVDETESVGLANVATNSWQTVNTEQATLEPDTTQTIQADQDRLQQLFENLYRNAVEHGGDGVTISIGVIDNGFYVADTGPGIPESDRGDVFDAGYSTNEDGTGFGLRIVEQIADAHGWEVAITESEEGGARFEITGVEKIE